MKIINTEDVIVALSTPPGVGAIAVIRLSGKGCIDIVSNVFKPVRKNFTLSKAKTHTVHFGSLVDGEKTIDEVLVTVMHAPLNLTQSGPPPLLPARDPSSRSGTHAS